MRMHGDGELELVWASDGELTVRNEVSRYCRHNCKPEEWPKPLRDLVVQTMSNVFCATTLLHSVHGTIMGFKAVLTSGSADPSPPSTYYCSGTTVAVILFPCFFEFEQVQNIVYSTHT
jgi:hypothetical protein